MKAQEKLRQRYMQGFKQRAEMIVLDRLGKRDQFIEAFWNGDDEAGMALIRDVLSNHRGEMEGIMNDIAAKELTDCPRCKGIAIQISPTEFFCERCLTQFIPAQSEQKDGQA